MVVLATANCTEDRLPDTNQIREMVSRLRRGKDGVRWVEEGEVGV